MIAHDAKGEERHELLHLMGQRLLETREIGVLVFVGFEDFFSIIKNEGDSRHVCGVSPIYIALSALSGATGKFMGYAQCPASEDETSMVSICGILY